MCGAKLCATIDRGVFQKTWIVQASWAEIEHEYYQWFFMLQKDMAARETPESLKIHPDAFFVSPKQF